MDKYLMVVLVFLFGGMAISATQDPPKWIMFYIMVAGSIFVIIYSSYKDRKMRRELKKRKYKK